MLRLRHATVIGRELALAWEDGGEGFVSFERLREMCPCAECRGEPDVLGRVVRPERSAGEGATELVGWEVVGGYALQLRWGDGHEAGLYPFELLRELGRR